MSPDEISPVRLVLSGATGRMGRIVARLAADDPAIEVIGGIDRSDADGLDAASAAEPRPDFSGTAEPRRDLSGATDPHADPSSRSGVQPPIATLDAAGPLLAGADVLVDFSAPAFTVQLLERYFTARQLEADRGRGTGTALVVGTTGLGPDAEGLLDLAARYVPVLTAANFSVGVNLLLALAERAAATLGREFDVEIVEAHHRRKEDAPSGTALALGKAVADGRGVELDEVRRDGRSGWPGARPAGEIGFHAVRGGDVIGEHHVLFLSDMERVELVHRASDRGLFAAGALRAARWVSGRPPGRYTMRDVLDF